jgi:hypothetical protein
LISTESTRLSGLAAWEAAAAEHGELKAGSGPDFDFHRDRKDRRAGDLRGNGSERGEVKVRA